MSADAQKLLGKNRKAFYEYEVVETLQTGIVLTGTEVKSIRMNHFNFSDAWANVENGELWLIGFSINPYSHGNLNNHEPLRRRKLLVHRLELNKLRRRIEEKGFTLVPTAVTLKGGLIKIEIGICKGKKMYDKRESIKAKDQKRDAEREMRRT